MGNLISIEEITKNQSDRPELAHRVMTHFFNHTMEMMEEGIEVAKIPFIGKYTKYIPKKEWK